MLIVIIVSCLFGMLGLLILFNTITTRLSWLETKGKICGFTESVHTDDSNERYIKYTAVYKFQVNGKEYTGQPPYGIDSWDREKPSFTNDVFILYDPDNPAKFVIKRNGILLGCTMLTLAIVTIIVTFVLNLFKMA